MHSLEKSDEVDAVNNHKASGKNSTDENYYKNKIINLNEEIVALNKKNKALSNELAMVSTLHGIL